MQEGILWMQKSMVDRLRLGYRNTKFFYTTTLVRRRRRRNKVEMLKDDEGRWVDDAEKLKQMAMKYYEKLFITETR